jgi:hypothetical protein
MASQISSVGTEAGAIRETAVELFGGLSHEQINWKPSEEVWSNGQILDHLNTTNESYLPNLEAVAANEYIPGFWGKIPLVPDFIGQQIKKAVSPESVKKVKAPAAFAPVLTEIDSTVVDEFLKTQDRLVEVIGKISDDMGSAVIASPVSEMVTLPVKDALEIIVLHERRHFAQATRLMDSAMFPV